MNVQSNALPPVALIHSAHWTDDQLAVWSTLSWRAVFTGVVIALAVQLLLSLLGAGIGFTLVSNTDPATAEHAGRAALGVGLWWIVTSVLAVFIGAWCASELSPPGTERSGALQGVVVWAVSTLAGVLLAGTLASGVAAHAYSLAGVSHAGIGMGRSFDGLARAPRFLRPIGNRVPPWRRRRPTISNGHVPKRPRRRRRAHRSSFSWVACWD